MDADQAGTDIADLVTPRSVIAQLRAPTKRQVLQELARRAAAMTGLPDRRIYDALAERERRVAILLYVENLTLREVGEVLGVSERRVCQIHGQLRRTLRATLDKDASLFSEVA